MTNNLQNYTFSHPTASIKLTVWCVILCLFEQCKLRFSQGDYVLNLEAQRQTSSSEYDRASRHTLRQVTSDSCHYKPMKSWHRVVQYLNPDMSATSCKNDTKNPPKTPELNTSANDTKAMAGNMWWQEAAFMSGCFTVFYVQNELLQWNSWERKHS